MAKPLFPSGPWVGFYVYDGYSQRFLMDLHLSFRAGRIEGEGADGLDTGGGAVLSTRGKAGEVF